MQRSAPIVLVAGFLGDGAAWYWGDVLAGHHVHYAQLGPVSSLHDRACELYYQIKGGTVDYGAAHAVQFGHARLGRTYPGFHQAWSAGRPVHLVGHSLGGCTVRYLQHLLAAGHFGPDGGDASWVRSITTIAAPHMGTTTAYILGEKEDTPADVHHLSVGGMLTRFIHVHEWLVGAAQRGLIDLQLDHWRFSWRDRTLGDLARFLVGRSPLSYSRDNAAYDMTVRALHEHNAGMAEHAATFYRSYACSMTAPAVPGEGGFHVPRPSMPALLRPLAYMIGRYVPTDEANLSKQFRAADWWENDGVVSTVSQAHPFLCSDDPARPCWHYDLEVDMGAPDREPVATATLRSQPVTVPIDHIASATPDTDDRQHDRGDAAQPRPGVWHVYHLHNCSHTCLLPFPSSKAFQRAVLSDYVWWLARVDRASCVAH